MPRKKDQNPKGEGKESNKNKDSIGRLQEDLESELGEDKVSSLSSSDALSKVTHWVSSGSVMVDSVFIGGRKQPCSIIPYGRQIEISGLNQSGKTTMCAMIAGQVQKQGNIVIVVDTEERIDSDYWTKLGADVDNIIRIQAHTLEEAFNKQEAAMRLAHEHFPDKRKLLIWDSIGSTSTDEILEFNPHSKAKNAETFMDKAKEAYGREARVIGLGVKGLNNLIAKTNTCYLYTNHLYLKMGVAYGDKWETYGGEKLKYMATVRIRLERGEAIKIPDLIDDSKQIQIGQYVRVKTLKNSMAPNYLDRTVALIGGEGFSDAYGLYAYGPKVGLVQKAGSWYTVAMPDGTEAKGQGWNGFKENIVAHKGYPEIIERFAELI